MDVVKDNIVTITRDSGTKLFNAVPSYSGASYNVVAIAIDASGITVSISNILNGYTVGYQSIDYKPEYEDLKRIAEDTGLALRKVKELIK